MIKYQYQILKYVHDHVTGEFVNIGVIIYSQDSKYLKAKFIDKYSRISKFFGELNGNYLIKLLRTLEKSINKSDLSIYSFDSLQDISYSFLPRDFNSIEFSEVKKGVLPNLNNIEKDKVFDTKLDSLYQRFVNKYMEEKEEIKDDSYVWKKLYKQYFDEYEITKKLKKHTIKTSQDEINFDKAWKNGVWHCYQPLSFDLKNSEKIKNKAYQWESILRELDTADEGVKVYLLTSLPNQKNNLQEFIEKKLKDIKLSNIELNFIKEEDAPSLALKVKKEMEESLHK